MAKFARHINSFVAGELSPRFYGRTDSNEYQQGAQEILNKLVRNQGGAMRRPGTLFCAPGIFDSNFNTTAFDSEVRTIDWRFSRTDASVVVLSTGNNGLNAYGIAIWSPILKKFVDITVSLSTDYKAFAGWTTQAELDEIQYAQSGDVMVLVSKKNPPIFLVRTDSVTYTLKDIYSLRDVFPAAYTNRVTYAGSNTAIQEKVSPSAAPDSSKPYYNVPYTLQDPSVYGTVSASSTSGAVTLTFSVKPGPGIIGTIVRMTKSGVTGFVKVTAGSSFVYTGTFLKNTGATGTQDSFELQSWGILDDTWPKVVAFHDQRIYYANAGVLTNTLWGSQVGDFTEIMVQRPADDANFSSLSNDRPFSYALASNSVDDIQWMFPSKSSLFIGTTGGEWLGMSGSDNILGPLFPNFQPQTTYGSKLMQAKNVNGSVIFVDRTGQHIREFTYNRDVDNYRAVDLNYFADHLIRKGIDIYSSYTFPEIKHMAFQDGQSSVVWILDSMGMLHALVKDRDYGTLAWSTMQFGGVSDADGRPPIVKSLVTIPNDTASDDDVYVIVQRYLDGVTKYYMEKLGQEFIGPSLAESNRDIQRQPVFMDAAVQVHKIASPKFFSRFTSSLNADYWTTSGTGTGTGSPSASSGLILTGGATKYVTYDSANAQLFQTGTIVIEIVPNYSGTPASSQYFFSMSQSNASQNNLATLYHDSATGNLLFALRDNAGANLNNFGITAWAPVSGTRYVIAISFDVTTGKNIMLVNGVRVSGNNTTMTRSGTIGNFVVGTSYNAGHTSNFTIKALGISSAAGLSDWYDLYANYSGKGYFYSAFSFDKHVAGVNHLYGSAPVLMDGMYQGELNLSTTALTTAPTITTLVGFKYTSRVKLMDLEAGSILGSAQGAIKRVHEITARFERSVGAKYGPATDKLDNIDFTPAGHTANTPIPLYTGDYTLKYRPGYSRNLTMIVQQELPYPCTLTSIVAKGMTSD